MTEERAQRLQRIGEEMSRIAAEIGPGLIRLSHLRKEARRILEEAGIREADAARDSELVP